jgi:hypothetical protein
MAALVALEAEVLRIVGEEPGHQASGTWCPCGWHHSALISFWRAA